MRIGFDRAKAIVAAATYETLLFHAEYESFSAEEIHERVKNYFGTGFVRRLLTSLSNENLISIDQFDETSPYSYTLTDEGMAYVESILPLKDLLAEENEAVVSRISAPTAQGEVPLNHNSSDYAEISNALDDAVELANSTKPNEVSGDQHTTILATLRSARELWRACQLTQMQLEVGIIMALKNAERQLKLSFKMARGSLLVEAVKTFLNAMKDGG